MDETRYRAAEARLWAFLGLTPTEQRLQLARVGTTVRVQELGEGPPVLFIHGGSNGGTSWAYLVARLAGFRCIMLDRPGCGLSEPVPKRLSDPAALAAFAQALVVDVLDALGIERAHLAATSFGGYVAIQSAAARPSRVDRLIEFGFPIGAPVGRTPFAMRLSGVPVLGRLMTAIPPNERVVRMLLKNIGLREAMEAGRFSQEAIDWYLALLRDTPTMRNELRGLPPLISPIRGLNPSLLLSDQILSSVRAPSYFLWGEQDLYAGPEVARQFVAKIPGAELELMPGGHAVWMDDPDRAAKVTMRFLAST